MVAHHNPPVQFWWRERQRAEPVTGRVVVSIPQQSRALPVIVCSALGNLVAYVSAFRGSAAPTWAPFVFAISTVAMLTAIIVLGAHRRDRKLGLLAIPIALVAVILLGGFLAALQVAPPSAGSRLFAGLPLGAAIVVYGIGLLPLVILPVAYALTFANMTLSDADIQRVRDAKRAPRAGE